MCMKDLSSVYQLQTHFDEVHSAELGDKDMVRQLKGLFGKAKKKILKKIEGTDSSHGSSVAVSPEDEVAEPFSSLHVDAGGFDDRLWEPQEFGATTNHTDFFKGVRDTRIDWFVVETNKLLIRLEKLLNYESHGFDPTKRKAFEKSIVPWAPDEDVRNCLTCGDKFSLSRRKHHCRLCGTILCQRCSEFLPYSVARKLTNPNNPDGSPVSKKTHRRQASGGSNGEEPEFRICRECEKILIRKAALIKEKTVVPILVQLYEKLRTAIDVVEDACPVFVEMAESLNAGETTHDLERAIDVRLKLLKKYEVIDLISKKIALHGLSGDTVPSQTAQKLQRMIRQSTTVYLQDTMVQLPQLPTREQYEQLKKKREAAIARRLEQQREAALEEKRREQERKEQERRRQERFQFSHMSSWSRDREDDSLEQRPVVRESVGAEGWGPAQMPSGGAAAAASASDPMLQQMDIIRSYIQQAREAQKYDEVNMLENNLKELQSEYWRQQQSSMQRQIDRM
ncbi:rabenosyn-5-like [Ptychodera flava]|uniref:rabenosyn-5-like n=1 Tax=Ptychodera flava TaxID=63121 RepID=UPI00396A0221